MFEPHSNDAVGLLLYLCLRNPYEKRDEKVVIVFNSIVGIRFDDKCMQSERPAYANGKSRARSGYRRCRQI